MRRVHLILALVLPWLLAADAAAPPPAPPWPGLIAGRLQPGDVILAGYPESPWAAGAALTSLPRHRFGHAGIVVRLPAGLRIVHASGNPAHGGHTARPDTPAHFLAGASHVGIYRPRQPGLGRRLARAAIQLGGRGLVFDDDFSLASADRLYCTELVWRALARALGHDPFPHKPVILARPVITLAQLETAPQLRLAAWIDGRAAG